MSRKHWIAGAIALGLAGSVSFAQLGEEGDPSSLWPSVSAHRQALELMHRGVFFEAARLLQQHVAAHAEDVPARFDLATVFFRLNRDRESVEELLVLLRQQPEHVRARRLMVRIRMRMGRNLDWNDPSAVLEFARLCSRMESYDRARACYSLLLRDNPDPAIQLEFATMLFWAQRYKEALVQFQSYLEHSPRDPVARHQYARALIAHGDIAEAEVELRESLALQPTSTAIRLDHARTLIWLDRLEEAEEQLRRITAREAAMTEPRLLLAELYLRLDRIENAYAMYQEVLRIDTGEERASRKVRDLEETRRIDMARLRRRIDEDPRRIEERNRYIQLLIEHGRTGEALRELEALARRTEEDPQLRAQISALRERQRAGVLRQLRVRAASGLPALKPYPVDAQYWKERNPEDVLATARQEWIRRSEIDAPMPAPVRGTGER